MCVYMYMYMCTHDTYIYMCVYVCIYIHTYVYTHKSLHKYPGSAFGRSISKDYGNYI